MPSLPHKHTVKVTEGIINRLQIKETTNIFCGAKTVKINYTRRSHKQRAFFEDLCKRKAEIF